MAHLKMKFAVDDKVVTMRVDQEVARKCYENSLRTLRNMYSIAQSAVSSPPNANDNTELDPRARPDHYGPQPIGELKEFEVAPGRKLWIGSTSTLVQKRNYARSFERM